MIRKNSVVKIENHVMSHELQPIESNPVIILQAKLDQVDKL